MKSKKLFRRWQSRRQKLLSELPGLLEQCQAMGNGDQVHQLRVTIRRLRLYVRLGRPLLDKAAVDDFLRWARTISKTTSHVRDLDVALEWLQGREGTEEAIEICQNRRSRAWRPACAKLRSPPDGLLRALTKVKKGGKPHARVMRRFVKFESRIQHSVQLSLPRFFNMREEEQHEFRRLIRWWRYLRELSLPRRTQKPDARLKQLIQVQEATGDRQNLLLTDAALQRLRASAHGQDLQRRLAAEQVTTTTRIRGALDALAHQWKWPRPSQAGPPR